MLVLSRKRNQNILFPNLGIAVEILRVAGNSVSVGIKAPATVQVLRGELAQEGLASPDSPQLPHALRNQLHKAQLAVALAQKQLRTGHVDDAETTLTDMLSRLQQFDADLLASRDLPHGDAQEPPSEKSATPARDSAATVGSGPTDRSSLLRHRRTPRAQQRALVVEDDANERALLAGYLRLCGMQVLEAADGMEALELLDSESVDLIVLDMRMPRLNGADTLRTLRSLPALRQTKIIVVSGESPDHSDYADLHSDVSDWFAKPLNPARLVDCLQPAGR